MVYDGTECLNWVSGYTQATNKPSYWPIKVNVPHDAMMVGLWGSATPQDIMTMAEEVKRQGLLGIIVWYSSVQNGFIYNQMSDAVYAVESQNAFKTAMSYLKD